MFTLIVFVGLATIAWLETWQDKQDAGRKPERFDDDRVRQSVVHARQDLRGIGYLLAGILLMLGVIADRL